MFWKSKGFGRAFSIVISAMALVPALEPYRELLMIVGTSLGVVAVANAHIRQ